MRNKRTKSVSRHLEYRMNLTSTIVWFLDRAQGVKEISLVTMSAPFGSDSLLFRALTLVPPVMIQTRDQLAPNTPQEAASKKCPPIYCSMACHRCGVALGARRAFACGIPVDRPADHSCTRPASPAVLV